MSIRKCVLAMAAGGIAMAVLPAMAVQRSYNINATGACNGALPSFEGALRKRPTAIANEGTAPAFVSCSVLSDSLNTEGNQLVGIGFNNHGATEVTFSCTLVDGYASPWGSGGGPSYYPMQITIGGHGSQAVLWYAVDEGVAHFTTSANLSCNLPPGVEINVLVTLFEDDGV